MLIRISLILAILLGLAVTGLNISMVKEKITTLQSNLKDEKEAHQKFENDFRRTKNDLDKTNAVLRTTQETLKATEEEKVKAKLAEIEAEKKRVAEQQAAQRTPQVAATHPAATTNEAAPDATPFKSVLSSATAPSLEFAEFFCDVPPFDKGRLGGIAACQEIKCLSFPLL